MFLVRQLAMSWILVLWVLPAYASSGARPPIGLQLFCLQQSSACRTTGASSVQWSEQLLVLLDRVNRNVNASIRPRSDIGVDRWQLGAQYGDCEDYVLSKRHKLIEHGVPAGALRIGYTKTSSGEGHAVLIVRTDRGDLLLDNLASRIKAVVESGYRIEKVSTSNVLVWSAYN